MKNLNITFTDKEFFQMSRIKHLFYKNRGITWHDFIMRLARRFKRGEK